MAVVGSGLPETQRGVEPSPCPYVAGFLELGVPSGCPAVYEYG